MPVPAMLRLMALLVLVLANAVASAADRKPLPNADDQKLAETLIKELFKAELAKTKVEDKITLGQAMLSRANASPEPAAQYAMWSEASKVASLAGDMETALDATEKLAAAFEIDEKTVRLATLTALSKSVKDAEKGKLVTALKTLIEKPDDPAANVVLGRHHAFLQNDLEKGLPMLAKGNDPALKALAEKETAAPTDAAAQGALGDAWWAAGEKESNKDIKVVPKLRAKFWYEKAMPGLVGAQKVTATLRIEETGQPFVPVRNIQDPLINNALEWLAKNQEPAGHWETRKTGGAQDLRTAFTGYALMCFLWSGNTEKSGKYQENVRKAVAWLISKQAANGLIYDMSEAAPNTTPGLGIPHGVAGCALVEAAASARVPATLAAAQKAVNYSTNTHQAAAGGFDFQAKGSSGRLWISCWFARQLLQAKGAGLTVSAPALDKLKKNIEALRKPSAKTPDIKIYREYEQNETERDLPRLIVIGIATKLLFSPKTDEDTKMYEWARKENGKPSKRVFDLDYWIFGTLCAVPLTDNGWIEALRSVAERTVEGDGGWSPVGYLDQNRGRVGQTAMICLSLIASYK